MRFRLAVLMCALAVLFVAGQASAEISRTISYQGVLKDAGGNAVPDGRYDLVFTIYIDPYIGLPLWQEPQSVIVRDGLFNTILGTVIALDLSFDQEYWLGIAVEGEPELTPRARLTSAPYAFRAAFADAADDGDWVVAGSNIYRLVGNVGVGTSAPAKKLDVVGDVGVTGQIDVTSSTTRAGTFTSTYDGCHAHAVDAQCTGSAGIAVYGQSSATSGQGIGGYFYGGDRGVYASAPAAATTTMGIYAISSGDGTTKYGAHTSAIGAGTNYGLYSTAYNGAVNYAGYFSGNVMVAGNLSKSSGSFRIDHPLDPANMYLQHSFVESPDMKNVYDGVALLDGAGEAWVELPEWFESLNQEFRYQLTPIGAPAPDLYIAEEVAGNRFKVAGGEPGMRVSWQLTGVRHDAYAERNRIPVEVEKPAVERGKYLHPELLGLPQSMAIGWTEAATAPETPER